MHFTKVSLESVTSWWFLTFQWDVSSYDSDLLVGFAVAWSLKDAKLYDWNNLLGCLLVSVVVA